MANRSVSSSSSTSQADLFNWVLIDHDSITAHVDDFDSICAEVLSLDSFVSDDETSEIDPSGLNLCSLVELGPTLFDSDGEFHGSMVDLGIADGDEGGIGNFVGNDDDGGNGNFRGRFDLGGNPFLERETLHQFIGNAIDALGGGSRVFSDFELRYMMIDCGYGNRDSGDRGIEIDVLDESVSGGMQRLEVDHYDNRDDDGEVDCDDEDEVDSGYGLDDELVPWGVVDRLGRQRMRKLGKRSFARMTKSKRMAHMYTMRGCVRGKHGLGLKAY